MITCSDLRKQYENEIGKEYASEKGYYNWVEKLYIDKLNEEQELNDKLTEFMLQDGE